MDPIKPIVELPIINPSTPVKDAIVDSKIESKEVPETKEESYVETKEDVHAKIGEILSQYSGLESNIPMSHEYWGLVNKYRTM